MPRRLGTQRPLLPVLGALSDAFSAIAAPSIDGAMWCSVALLPPRLLEGTAEDLARNIADVNATSPARLLLFQAR